MSIYQRIKLLPYEKYERIKLPYELGELAEIVSFRTMYYHYDILHKNYELKLLEILRGKKIEEESETEKQFPTLIKLMENLEQLPEGIRKNVRFFGGGLINHNFFFAHLTKFKVQPADYQVEKRIDYDLLNLIQEKFVNFERLKRELVKSALQVQGSGWTWLVLDQNKKLQIINTANQDGPWALKLKPLIAIDLWEHAYIYDYGARRQEYVENLINHLLNWEYISQLYLDYTLLNSSF